MAWAIPLGLGAANLLSGLFDKKSNKKAAKKGLVGAGGMQSSLSPQQTALLNQLISQAGGNLSQGDIKQNSLFQGGSSFLQNLFSNDPQQQQSFEAPYMRQFNEQTIPDLAERFAGLGAGSSSAFQNALGQAGASLQEKLAHLRSGNQLGALGSALSFSQQPISNLMQFLNASLGGTMSGGGGPAAQQQGQPGAFSRFLAPINSGIGGALGQSVGTGLIKNLSTQFPSIFG